MVEKMSYNEGSFKLITSEAARLWTESSQNSKLLKIANKLAYYNGDDGDDLRNLIEKREYTEFQSKIGITNPKDLDGKLGPKTLEIFNNFLRTRRNLQTLKKNIKDGRQDNDKDKTQNNSSDVFQDYVHRPEYQQLTDSAKIHKNTREYLSKHESLSEDEYNRIFSGKENLAQGQIGNCYMVAPLIELTNTQYFDTLMRTSITRVRFNDDGLSGYNIRIPLGEPNGRDILIKDSELNTAKIRGNIGYQLLEIAYVKSRRKNDAEGNRYSPVTEWEYQAISGGTIEGALKTFLGKNNIGFSNFGTFPIWKSGKTLSEASEEQKTEIINCLKNFNGNVGDNFIGLATAPSPQGDTENFSVGGNTFWKNHAYALNSVEKDSNGDISYVNVKNTWNNRYKEGGSDSRITLQEFFDTFSYIGVGKVKVDTFLDENGIDYA